MPGPISRTCTLCDRFLHSRPRPVELEDFVSSASIEEDSQTTQARLQNDIMLSVGVAIPVWPRR